MLASALWAILGGVRHQWKRLVGRWRASPIPPDAGYVFTADYCTWLAPSWSQHLAAFRGIPHLRFLEIGSFEGRSAIWFLEHILTHPTASITCVDSFSRRNGETRFDHNIRVSGFAGKVTKRKGRSDEILGTLPPASFDAIYVDGSHMAVDVLMDAVSSWLLLKPGGLLIFDDYGWRMDAPPLKRPQMAIDLFLAAFGGQLELLHKEWQVIVRKTLAARMAA
jgi:SAM-dependent methyltransferase